MPDRSRANVYRCLGSLVGVPEVTIFLWAITRCSTDVEQQYRSIVYNTNSTMHDMMHDMMVISIIQGKPLLFALADVRRARTLGIIGMLVGTLPLAPQQNLFLGLPLQLTLEECHWLVTHGHAMVSGEYTHPQDLAYSVFSDLKDRGYCLSPGLRFGGQFIGYPGDPLRYHAHLIVNTVRWDDDIGLTKLIGGGRLATGVKKLWVVGSQAEGTTTTTDDKQQGDHNDEITSTNEVVCFSVEWAGFG